jgi:hypothetical protein
MSKPRRPERDSAAEVEQRRHPLEKAPARVPPKDDFARKLVLRKGRIAHDIDLEL